MKECTTHYFACDCREAHFKELLAQAEAMAETLSCIKPAVITFESEIPGKWVLSDNIETHLKAWQKFKESL